VPWVRFDDQFSIHRKVTGLSDAAFRLHVSAIFWCARNLTDGVVPEEDLEVVCARVRTPQRFVAELLKRGAWHEIGTECHSEDCPAHPDNDATNGVTDGWVIHDYLEFQYSKERVMREREGNAARQKKWRDQQKRKGNGVTDPDNASSNGVSHSVSNETPSRPVPSRSSGGSPSRHLQVGDARAKPDEDEDLDKVNDQIEGRVIELLVELTGRTVDRAWASKIRRQILDGRPDVKNPLRYVSSAVRGDPARYLPAADPGTELGAEVISTVRGNDWETSAQTARRRAAEARAALKGKT
jgi:hypothetical protein